LTFKKIDPEATEISPEANTCIMLEIVSVLPLPDHQQEQAFLVRKDQTHIANKGYFCIEKDIEIATF